MLSRRTALKTIAASTLAASLPQLARGAEDAKPRKILFFTKSVTFEHPVVKRKGDELAHAEKILTELGKKNGYEVIATKDGTIFDRRLADFAAFFFFTTGDLTAKASDGSPSMSAAGKAALLEAVHGGKGFLGSHCASDTFHSPGKAFETQTVRDPYIAMLGGEFIRHGEQQKAALRVTDASFPGLKGAQAPPEIHEEWYSLKNFAPDLHVIHVLETKGMRNPDYQRPPFPVTWARRHGKGRVWYTALGHREDVWTNPLFQDMVVGALAWATGQKETDLSPNLNQVAPGAETIPPEK